jgi:hypothetical protein
VVAILELDPVGQRDFALETSSAVLSHVAELVGHWGSGQALPTSVDIEDVKDALEGISEGLDLLREGDLEQACEQIEAVAGALDPSLLDDDSGEGSSPSPHAVREGK